MSMITKNFEEDKVIKTGLFGKSLTISNVLNYIDQFMPDLSKNIDIPEINF